MNIKGDTCSKGLAPRKCWLNFYFSSSILPFLFSFSMDVGTDLPTYSLLTFGLTPLSEGYRLLSPSDRKAQKPQPAAEGLPRPWDSIIST